MKRIWGIILAIALVVTMPLLADTSSMASSYTVVRGDSLWKIAREQLGDGFRYIDIFEANKDKILDPTRIQIGQVLELPKVQDTVIKDNSEQVIADRVFTNAKVYSVNIYGVETRAEAVAIKDGKFIFVGSDRDVERYIGKDTIVTDCQGGSVLPGFIDSHMHFASSIRRFGEADLSDLVEDFEKETPEDIIKKIQNKVKEFADSHPDDEVIHGSGWDKNWFEGALGGKLYEISRHDIDAVISDRPVALNSVCGHVCLFNTKALEAAGLDKNYVEPKGSFVRREADGSLTGYVQEASAINEICHKIPGYEYSNEHQKKVLKESQDFFAARGFTYLSDFMKNDQTYNVIKEMAENGELKIRIDGSYTCKERTMEEDLKKAISEKGKYDVGDLLKVDNIKYFIDEEFSMFEPYEEAYRKENNMPDNAGTEENLLWDLKAFTEAMAKATAAGYSNHVHSYGDRATHETIKCMIDARKASPNSALRDAITHIFFIRDDDIKLMAENGIIGNIQPQWGNPNRIEDASLYKQVGEERYKGVYPNGSLARGGVRLAYSSDFTVTVPDALSGITIALTRTAVKTENNYENFKHIPVINPNEITTLKDAIMGWTINGAYQFGREDITGSIEVGKSAELVVLNGDIENTPAEDICLLKIKETVFKGETTYKDSAAATETATENKYKTKEEWEKEFVVPEYAPNNEIKGEYDKTLAAKCKNGTFVGKNEDDVKVWRGIPYAKQPVGELRFKAPQPAEASDSVYEAYHFMKSGMQQTDPEEIASMYPQGEECLGLNVWSGIDSKEAAKPVLVYIHGGGWFAGGTQDPLYNGQDFAKNNPDILVVTIGYRIGMLGQIDLSAFPDGKDYAGSEALGMLDIIESLKWIKENIAAFGGDPNNITVCGESAGGGAVSMLCTMPKAKGLFNKAIPMSGSVTQFNDISRTLNQVPALKNEFGANTVADLQNIPFEKLKTWWAVNAQNIYHHPVRGGDIIEADPFTAWDRGDSSDINILQGHTAEEFHYYYVVFGEMDEMFDAVCEGTSKEFLESSGSEYAKDYQAYVEVMKKLGYSGNRIYWKLMDDHFFNAGNVYQAEMHAKNGGKGYFYTFEKGYDGDFEKVGAGHGVDCHYLFGTFNGTTAEGTPEEVELSKKFQKMIANFCKTGNPSLDGLNWPEYSNDKRARMIIGDNLRVEENPEKDRVDLVLRMMAHSEMFRYVGNESTMIEAARKINPQIVEEYEKKMEEVHK